MPKKSKPSVQPTSLRAERAELVGQVAAAKQRIADLLLAGENTADERTEVARLTVRIAEIDNALMRQVERDHGDDLLAVDRETQRLLADHRAALEAMRGVLTLTFVNT
jgi:hypothetical protein